MYQRRRTGKSERHHFGLVHEKSRGRGVNVGGGGVSKKVKTHKNSKIITKIMKPVKVQNQLS